MVKLKAKKVGSLKQLKKSTKGRQSGAIKNVPKDESITIRFLEEPDEWIEYFEYYSETMEPRSFPDVEGLDPDFVADLRKPSKRFLANAVSRDNNEVIAMKLPATLASSLGKYAEKYGTILDRDYELSKEGTGLDTEYTAFPEAPSRFSPARFKKLDLMDVLVQQLPDEIKESLGMDLDDDDDDDDEPVTRTAVKRKPVGRTRTGEKAGGIKKRPLSKR